MILVDACVWGNHFRRSNPMLIDLLRDARVLIHPAVLGELALSNLKKRRETLDLLRRLPQSRSASDGEVLMFIEALHLYDRGIGWVDAHLLASARLTNCDLWTTDGPLRAAALHVRIPTHSP